MSQPRPTRFKAPLDDRPQAYLTRHVMRQMAADKPATPMDSPVARITLPGSMRTVSPIDLLLLAKSLDRKVRHGGKA